MKLWRGVCVGSGYFSQFHLDAWQRMEDVEIVALCDRDLPKAERAAQKFEVRRAVADPVEAIREFRPDFVDIITRADSHLELVQAAAGQVGAIICQKPLADNLAAAETIVATAERSGTKLMVHENYRFQPWHREIKKLISAGTIGDKLHTLTFLSRPGDGWGPDAYLSRQPYFRSMPRLLIQETGVHLIDTFRFLAGEIEETWTMLRRLNDVIVGEDTCLMTFKFASGAVGVWDCNRYNESTSSDFRYTFGEFLVEGNGGSIRLHEDGSLTVQPLGKPEYKHDFTPSRHSFSGDCVFTTQRHFIDCLAKGVPFETAGREYLKTLTVVEAVYQSAAINRSVRIRQSSAPVTAEPPRRRIIDLTLPIDANLPNASVTPLKRLETDGVNTSTLTLYSHCGTHMDAPRHFVPNGAPLETLSLEACHGPARVLDLTPIAPRELIGVQHLKRWEDQIGPGDRLLLRTDWSKTFGTPAYRNELPRISRELAEWLANRRIALLGVEPPSVCDVNNLEELTTIHRILLGAGIVIVEGLTNLDQLRQEHVEFTALPLRITGGDGCPVRAIAVESAS